MSPAHIAVAAEPEAVRKVSLPKEGPEGTSGTGKSSRKGSRKQSSSKEDGAFGRAEGVVSVASEDGPLMRQQSKLRVEAADVSFADAARALVEGAAARGRGATKDETSRLESEQSKIFPAGVFDLARPLSD